MANVDYFWRKAMEYMQRAEETTDEEVRTFFYRVRDGWIAAGNRAKMIEEIDMHMPIRLPAGTERAAIKH